MIIRKVKFLIICTFAIMGLSLSARAMDLVIGVDSQSSGTGIQYSDPEGQKSAYEELSRLSTEDISSAQQSTDDLGNPLMRVVLTPAGIAKIAAAQSVAFQKVPPMTAKVFVEGQQVGILDFGPGNEGGPVSIDSKPVGLTLLITDLTKPFITKIVSSIGQP